MTVAGSPSQKPSVGRDGGETERAGFEPAMEFDPHTRLAGECLQPLGHLSREGDASVEPAIPARRRSDARSLASGTFAIMNRTEGWQSG